MYSSDIYKIYYQKAPATFSGSGNPFSFVLPFLNDDGTEAWTRSPRFHPNDKDRTDEVASSIWKKEFLSTADTWNIWRWEGSAFPPKSIEDSRVFREGGIWAGTVRAPRLVNQEKSLQGMAAAAEGKKKGRPIMNTVKNEQWPEKLNTGRKYRPACQTTRASLSSYLEDVRQNPSMLEGPSDWEEDKKFRKATQQLPEAAMLRERSRIFGPSLDPDRSGQRSRSPCAVGPAAARLSPQALPTTDPVTGALCYKLSDTISKSSASSDRWADSASSLGGHEGLEQTVAALSASPHPATAALPAALPAEAPLSRGPSSVASAEPGWEVVRGEKPKKRKGQTPSAVSSSKASRVSEVFEHAKGFMKKSPLSS